MTGSATTRGQMLVEGAILVASDVEDGEVAAEDAQWPTARTMLRERGRISGPTGSRGR
jgi:hypothetical protein